jgi:hypothetical protein
MSDTQILTIALASVPTVIAVLVGILINNSRLGRTNSRISKLNASISDLRSHMDRRFDEARDTWFTSLKHLEER